MKSQLVLQFLLAAYLTIVVAVPLFAQQDPLPETGQHIVIRVDGASCPFCAFGLEKRLGHIEGVAQVRMEMKDGKAIVILRKDAKVSEQALRQAVEEAGFTPRDISFSDS